MNDKDTTERPWYCHRWPWFLMAGPFVVVIAGIVTTYLAIRSNDGLVADGQEHRQDGDHCQLDVL